MDAEGIQKSERIGTVEKYPTKAAATKRATKIRDEINERVTCIKVSGLCDRYAKDGMPERESTSGPYRSYLKRFREDWGNHRLDEMAKDVMAIEQWLNDYQTLPTPDRTVKGLLIKGRPPRPASKKTKTLMRGFIHRVFELAIKWGYLTMQRNPIGLVEIKGKSKRSRPLVIITGEQWRNMIADPELSPHVRVMMIVAMLLGLRASELLGLRWEDIDIENGILSVRRSYVGKSVDDTKTPESEQELPTHDDLRLVLKAWREAEEPINGWLFGNIVTGRPFWRGQLQKNHLIPVGQRHGIPHLGWHAFRHTYRAMMRELEIPLEMQRTLMRHSDIKTTLGYGGKTPAEHGRKSNDKVVEMLRKKA
jgi:integrase